MNGSLPAVRSAIALATNAPLRRKPMWEERRLTDGEFQRTPRPAKGKGRNPYSPMRLALGDKKRREPDIVAGAGQSNGKENSLGLRSVLLGKPQKRCRPRTSDVEPCSQTIPFKQVSESSKQSTVGTVGQKGANSRKDNQLCLVESQGQEGTPNTGMDIEVGVEEEGSSMPQGGPRILSRVMSPLPRRQL
ncbi:hypothetical protein OIU79_005642 [Salix purpurea]|uniref:Uncharacterized protein n=1 Tax=Salix purpurea TaxID=77065 RepID=A0A9Q0TTS2_SALPP|nr:hypothetical protein OIU79_005642 [Salix purpurea]